MIRLFDNKIFGFPLGTSEILSLTLIFVLGLFWCIENGNLVNVQQLERTIDCTIRFDSKTYHLQCTFVESILSKCFKVAEVLEEFSFRTCLLVFGSNENSWFRSILKC